MILATVAVLVLSSAVLAAFFGGVLLCFRGVRGRRVDAHPLCRRCGYDLSGHPERPDRCPECGSDTTEPESVVLGHRVLSRGRLLAGASLIVLSGTPLTLSGCYDASRRSFTTATARPAAAAPASPAVVTRAR